MKRIFVLCLLLVLCGCNKVDTNEVANKEITDVPQTEILEGSYADSNSQRAMLTVSKTDEGYYFVVSWSQSANETKTWSMDVKLQDDKLVYGGENIAMYTLDDKGNELVADGATNCAGYFEIKDSSILWTGACEDNLKTCVFEYIEQ